MDNMVTLRCKYCGAPLDPESIRGDASFVTCQSCGTSQQRIDAEAYLEQLMGQVRSWINKTVPGGIATAQPTSVDGVARYNIYMTNVKPRIDLEFNEYKFALSSLLSHSMMVTPFMVKTDVNPQHPASQIFEFGEKLNGVEPLAAVDENSGRSLREAKSLSDAYALLINNSKILKEDKPGRYILMSNNFKEAAADFSKAEGYQPAVDRFEGLAELCQGCETLLNGDIASSYPHFQKGKGLLQKARQSALTNMKVAIMGPAVLEELKQAESLETLSRRVDTTENPLEVLDAVRRINTYSYPKVGVWAGMLDNRDRLGEILGYLSECVKARNGGADIRVASGSGDILVPFWDVELRYSFQSGALWKKRGVEVDERLLVSADFVIDQACLASPRTAVTDVFGAGYDEGIGASLAGTEKSISRGQEVRALADSASPGSASGRRIVVPLSTRREAERLAEMYISQAAQSNGKIKLSNPEVSGIVYVPCQISGSGIIAPKGFGALVPDRIGRTDLGQLIIV